MMGGGTPCAAQELAVDRQGTVREVQCDAGGRRRCCLAYLPREAAMSPSRGFSAAGAAAPPGSEAVGSQSWLQHIGDL